MDIEWVRRYCMSMPHATEGVQWGANLVFKAGGRIFAIVALEPAKVWLSLKCRPEEFVELVERIGIVQEPHFARNQWIALETEDAVTPAELKRLVRTSYELVVGKLPKKTRAALL
jgi:predicted DNA-binding protein (MmcQ/YjbR family)